MDIDFRLREQEQVELLLKSLRPEQLRFLKHENMEIHNWVQLNQFVLGRGLSERLDWQTLVTVKLKYMFSPPLVQELREAFDALSTKLCRSEKLNSLRDQLLIALMKIIASWDVNIRALFVDKRAFQQLPQYVSGLVHACLMELSDLTEVFFLENEIEEEQSLQA